MSDLTPLAEAQSSVLSLCSRLEPKKLELQDASGTVLAEDIFAKEQVPGFDNTAMDGFAVLSADTMSSSPGSPSELKIVTTLMAGSSPSEILSAEIQSGEAVRIMTGAPIPTGADAVIMVEKTKTLERDGKEYLVLEEPVQEGNFIRRRGEDVEVGQKLISEGQALTPARLGVLAGQGVFEVLTYNKCKVGVMSTGKELVGDDSPLQPGQIRDSNRQMLLSMVQKLGMEAIDLGIVDDTEKAVIDAFQKASESCTALIVSGGVSMGDYDYVKKVLTSNVDSGATEGYALQVAIKPAKPVAFGRIGDLMVFGLPGNPVSSVVSFELFARPGLRKMMGHKDLHRTRLKATLVEDFLRRPDGKTHFSRVIWDYKDGRYEIRPAGGQGSHQLKTLADSNGLAIIEDGEGLKAGESVDFICLD